VNPSDHGKPGLGGRIVAVVFTGGLTLLFLGPWAYLVWDRVANGEPTTWWRLIGMILLPLPGMFCLLLTVMCVFGNSAGPSPAPADEDDLDESLEEMPIYIQRTDRPDAPLIPMGTLDDMEKMLDRPGEFEKVVAAADAATDRKGPRRPVLYAFQHRALRDAAFENHPELIRELAEPSRYCLLSHSRTRARIWCEDAGLVSDDELDDDAALEAEEKLFESVAIHPRKRDGFTAYVVTMPPPEFCPEAHLVAIVHKDAEPHVYPKPSPSTRYFTLEKADGSVRPLLCEWGRDGSRKNYGPGPVPEVDAFAAEVLNRAVDGVN
jgi:hypothetical protein